MKLKGCTYHDHFQKVLKSCKLRLQASSEIKLRVFYEPANVADENAIVAQVLQDQDWVPISFIPGKKKYKKFLMHSNHLLSKLSSLRK